MSLRTLRFDNYGLRATVGRVFFVVWATGSSTQQMVLKYKVKIADYRQQSTKKEPRQTPHYKDRLVFILSSQKLPFEKARDTLVESVLLHGNTMISASNLSIQTNAYLN